MPAHRSSTRAMAALALAALALLAAPAASAHTALVGTDPEEGGTVTELTEVSLEFTEALLEIGNELVLESADGEETALEPRFPEPQIIAADVADDALAPGETTLRWRVVAGDGHPIEGTVTFTYAPEPGETEPAETSAESSATPAATAGASTASSPSAAVVSTPAATADADPGADGTPAWVWIAGAAALGAAATAAAVALTRKGSRG